MKVYSLIVLILLLKLARPAVAQSVTTDTTAEKMLAYQRQVGGWPKAIIRNKKEVKVDYQKPMTAAQLAEMRGDSLVNEDATIDNDATNREIRYLVTAYKQTHNPTYLRAAEKGIRYLLTAQLPSGGWPQYYPDSSSYYGQITYNDGAMVNVLRIMKDVVDGKKDFDLVDKLLIPKAKTAISRGIDCMVKTQNSANGKLTAWCAQHDRRTLKACKARAYELPSNSGFETVGIVEFLMTVDTPSAEIRRAITSAVAWLNAVKIVGYTVQTIDAPAQPRGKDVVMVSNPTSTIWARFYDLDTNKPFFCGRDGIKKATLAEIENERRAGYAYLGTWPTKLLAVEYPKWAKKYDSGK